MNENITAGVDESGIEIKCSYTNENVITIFTVGLLVKGKTKESTFFTIVTFVPGVGTSINPSGEYLSDRITMTNITQESTEAAMIFKQIKCTDQNQYRCKVTYLNANSDPDTEMSLPTTIIVKVPPTKPHSLSIRGTVVSLSETDNATFICKGNVGRPPGKFIWRKRRSEDNFPEIYAHEKTNYTKLEESCLYEGLSALTITLSDKDNQAVISCAVESLMSHDAMFVNTLPIDVLCKYFILNCR
ncbi:unnamed protein product [Mytilus edulis]|uniref:Ig-like domain-containing protein n=1 Tax=Mytilus edulis TaxID=6550 RepID=A0A8S3SL28_MYTED|nr:unnamed protein product [Mytilus edulis]